MAIKKIKQFALFACIIGIFFSCNRPIEPYDTKDVVLIGGGIMSATLASLLHELDPSLTMVLYEKLPDIALESSAALNNAGTGHAAYCELNYTPEKNGVIDTKKAIDISEAFEISKQFWAYQVKHGNLPKPSTFINNVPHMSLVWGEDNIAYLKNRYEALIQHPLFFGMEYSEDKNIIADWAPLVMKGRDPTQKIAATRMNRGVDVDFGALTKGLIDALEKSQSFSLLVNHEVVDIERQHDNRWKIVVKDLKQNQKRAILARFVFIGAGGGALPLLQKSGISEAKGFGGFPVGGAWLISDKEELVNNHLAKVYGKASVGSPPMSVPHLDTRFINGQKKLLFGPFATSSTKFLKQGSIFDLPMSVSFGNIIPMLEVGIKNLDLVGYLIGQVLMSKEKRLESLREYMPTAQLEDWEFATAGQRVQIIKDDAEKGGVLQFGTELVSSFDKSIVALLGASPGASVAVKVMLEVIEQSFSDRFDTKEWQATLKKIIPSWGQKIGHNPVLLEHIRNYSRQALELQH